MDFDRRTLLLAPLALSVCGFAQPVLPQQWNGGHPEALNPIWDLLAQPKVNVDARNGLMTAAFTPDVKKMAGAVVKVDGFILPLEPGRETIHFALTRRNSGCPFCPPSQPTEAAEVLLTRPIKISGDLITVTGKLVLHASSDQGMFYQLQGATVA
ncbi:MAG: hypothetical protein JWP50_567 [Phenylobacterium sp.]|nr:hypothetical protein [Phenylobacterium sp.]